VRVRPIAIPAIDPYHFELVAQSITRTKINVTTTSITNAESILYPEGDASPKPFCAREVTIHTFPLMIK
jgi:hypothetical protein